jgi:SAM-dependent methyltransferase
VSWSELANWWLSETAGDAAYEEVVTPLLLEVLQPEPGRLYLDLGCGEGRVMRTVTALGGVVHGVDMNPTLAALAERAVVADLPSTPFRDGSYDGVYSVLTLEHIDDHRALFAEAARVTKVDGILAIVINHPIWTAPQSTPITDWDGEVLWRPGEYFSTGSSEVPAGDSTVTFHHRTMANLLTSAASAGWSLQQMVERPHHEFEDQSGIPRLLGCRWNRSPR